MKWPSLWKLTRVKSIPPSCSKTTEATSSTTSRARSNTTRKCSTRNARTPDLGTKARQDAAMLPSGHAVDRILRYDTVLERQIFRAMDQLEKLQSRRRQSEASVQNSRPLASISG